ncbi:MAG: hypothetical protein ACK5LV_02840 [Lachnospirales bacterium]
MSKFLGPIHYWLYNKILVEEDIILAIFDTIKSKGAEYNSILNFCNSEYGEPVKGDLEDIIDSSNIHGWLQNRIASVEKRLAYVVVEALKDGLLTFEEIENVFVENSEKYANESESYNTPEQCFNGVYTYLLAGMPCDRVNVVVENTNEYIKWEQSIDVHKQYWDIVGGSVDTFHKLIEKWIEVFVTSKGMTFRKENDFNIIGV